MLEYDFVELYGHLNEKSNGWKISWEIVNFPKFRNHSELIYIKFYSLILKKHNFIIMTPLSEYV